MARAGPVWSIRSGEWLWIGLYVLACSACAALVAVASQRRFIWGAAVGAPPLAGLWLATAGFETTLTPIVIESRHLTMRDGAQVAVSTYLPRARRPTERLPTILLQTRYHRAQVNRFPYNLLLPPPTGPSPLTQVAVPRGYAYVTVDVRGSGASFGFRTMPFSPAEVRDGAEVVDWIVSQPWSDGVVGAEGISYNGTTAELLLANRHPAVKAVMPMFAMYDAFTDITFPGGVFADNFLRAWRDLNWHLDRDQFADYLGSSTIKGVRPVDGDRGGEALARALRDHEQSYDVFKVGSQIEYKDDVVETFSLPAMSPYGYQEEIRGSGAAMYSISGWYDGAYQYSAIKRFLTTPTPGSRLLIGPWDHGGRQNVSPCDTTRERFDLVQEALGFFDYHLKGIETEIDRLPLVRYYVMCAEEWRTATTWPPPAQPLTFYLAPDGMLSRDQPAIARASDRYQVDMSATSGSGSRWKSYVNLHRERIGYPDRREQDRKLLTYSTAPLANAMEIVGHPVFILHVSSTATDGQFFAYLEDVDASGNVTYITEGQLRAVHRRLSDAEPPYRMVTPYRTFARDDALPLVPGEPAELVFDLWPTAYLIRPGHSIRLALAGADADNFVSLTGDPPTLRVYREASRASRVVLPVVETEGKTGQ